MREATLANGRSEDNVIYIVFDIDICRIYTLHDSLGVLKY